MYALFQRNGLLSLFSTLLSTIAFAQSSPTSGDIYLDLRKLNVLGSVLYVAAHPDDENTRLLTYFSKDKLYRTGYLSLTRGDGGQNLIGDEQGVELGLIRTQELLAARRTDGAEQFFSRAFDFGFSKTPEETFAKWNKEKVLADAVWVIRQFQPDVIITRFPTTGEGGHGHHTASAIIAGEAFTAAADPTRFPEQLKWVKPWQAKRLIWNTFNFGSNNTQRDDQFHFDVGGYNPVLGRSYGEIAADSRSQHKSQGFGVPRTRGEALEYFRPVAGAPIATDLFDEVRIGWDRVEGSEAVAAAINAAIAKYDFLQPQASVPALVSIYKALKTLPSGFWRDVKMEEVKSLIESAGGLWIEAFAPQQFAVQGDSLTINTVLNNRLGVKVVVDTIYSQELGRGFAGRSELQKNRNKTSTTKIAIAANTLPTQPYWLREPMGEAMFAVSDQPLIGKPDVQPAFTVSFQLLIEGEPFSYTKPVVYKFTDPVRGELYQPLVVLPKAELAFTADNHLSINGAPVKAGVQVIANSKLPTTYTVNYQTSGAWTSNPKTTTLTTEIGGEELLTATLTPSTRKQNRREEMVVKATDGVATYDQRRRSIQYDHIPSITYFPKASTNLVQVDVVTKGKKIGYVVGAGDKVPQALESMGYDVTLITEKEIGRIALKSFDAIITGVRAYNTAEWLNNAHNKLMKYVEEGGNLIVQYNTSNQIGPVRAKIGPYPFTISRNRITNETATVNFLKPDHSVLVYPNKITADDFKGWTQERSIYHAAGWGVPFEPILRIADPGEAADDGSLIIAKHGKGYFTYTGLVFFRELPAGVPGAYRLMANLIALNQKKEI